jgi:hypothetical protein
LKQLSQSLQIPRDGELLIKRLYEDRKLRQFVLSFMVLVAEEYEAYLENEQYSVESCDRIFRAVAGVAARHYVNFFEKDLSLVIDTMIAQVTR